MHSLEVRIAVVYMYDGIKILKINSLQPLLCSIACTACGSVSVFPKCTKFMRKIPPRRSEDVGQVNPSIMQ